MSEPIEITPELLAEIEAKAEFVEPKTYRLNENGDIVCDNPHLSGDTILIARVEFGEDAEYIAAADPATVLAMSKEIKRLWAAQCWAIVTIETGVVDGPYATFEAAENERLAELCDDPNEPMYRVEPWKGGA